MQNMNLMLNMKDINKILAKVHFKCKYKQEKIWIIIPLSVYINMICAWSWISLQTRKTSVLLFIHSFLAHLAKGHVSFCHHVSSVVSPWSSSVVSFSHFNLLLRNHWVNLDQIWWNGPWMAPFQNCVRWSRLPFIWPLKIEKKGDEILIVHCCFSTTQNELKF